MTQNTHDSSAEATGTVRTLIIGEGQFILDGQVIPVQGGGSVHQVAIAHIAGEATSPVQVTTVDDGGTQQIQVGPDGGVTPIGQGSPTLTDRATPAPPQRDAGAGTNGNDETPLVGDATPIGQRLTTLTDRAAPAKRAISPTGGVHATAQVEHRPENEEGPAVTPPSATAGPARDSNVQTPKYRITSCSSPTDPAVTCGAAGVGDVPTRCR